MDKGTQVIRFGVMSFIGIAGMIFLRDILFNVASLIFIVSTLIFIMVLFIPDTHSRQHSLRRRI